MTKNSVSKQSSADITKKGPNPIIKFFEPILRLFRPTTKDIPAGKLGGLKDPREDIVPILDASKASEAEVLRNTLLQIQKLEALEAKKSQAETATTKSNKNEGVITLNHGIDLTKESSTDSAKATFASNNQSVKESATPSQEIKTAITSNKSTANFREASAESELQEEQSKAKTATTSTIKSNETADFFSIEKNMASNLLFSANSYLTRNGYELTLTPETRTKEKDRIVSAILDTKPTTEELSELQKGLFPNTLETNKENDLTQYLPQGKTLLDRASQQTQGDLSSIKQSPTENAKYNTIISALFNDRQDIKQAQTPSPNPSQPTAQALKDLQQQQQNGGGGRI